MRPTFKDFGGVKLDGVEEPSSGLVDRQMGLKSGRWGVGYGRSAYRLGGGDFVGLGWIVFTGAVATVDYSVHWARRLWSFGCKEVIFGTIQSCAGLRFKPKPNPFPMSDGVQVSRHGLLDGTVVFKVEYWLSRYTGRFRRIDGLLNSSNDFRAQLRSWKNALSFMRVLASTFSMILGADLVCADPAVTSRLAQDWKTTSLWLKCTNSRLTGISGLLWIDNFLELSTILNQLIYVLSCFKYSNGLLWPELESAKSLDNIMDDVMLHQGGQWGLSLSLFGELTTASCSACWAVQAADTLEVQLSRSFKASPATLPNFRQPNDTNRGNRMPHAGWPTPIYPVYIDHWL
ncbi:hypothetical protein FB451DRAFT_1195326 [Mycena latifolia]|nr:hypothetical protein FB451DRAFT_1195326 [Mycena latifolia]